MTKLDAVTTTATKDQDSVIKNTDGAAKIDVIDTSAAGIQKENYDIKMCPLDISNVKNMMTIVTAQLFRCLIVTPSQTFT